MTSPFLPQSWFFSWGDPTIPTPIPVTYPCQTIDISWARGAALASAPSGVAPYSFTILSSIHPQPLIVGVGSTLEANLTIPFPVNTQYEICMYDSVGNSGGCQAMYSVFEPPGFNATTTCANFTEPGTALTINTTTSRFGWVAQCDYIEMAFPDGRGPFDVSILPALRDPLNLTVQDTLKWQNILGYSTAFFISVTDQDNRKAAWGPMHSGGEGTTGCLDYLHEEKSTSSKNDGGVIAGVAIAMLVVGAVLALIAAWAFNRYSRKKHVPDTVPVAFTTEPQTQNGGQDGYLSGVPKPPESSVGHGYGMPSMGYADVHSPLSDDGTMRENYRTSGLSSGGMSDAGASTSRPGRQSQNVYVLHHDGGRAPVTIFTGANDNIVELPPPFDASAPAPAGPSSQAPDPQPSADSFAALLSPNQGGGGSDTGHTSASDRKRPILRASTPIPEDPQDAEVAPPSNSMDQEQLQAMMGQGPRTLPAQPQGSSRTPEKSGRF